MTIEQDQWTNMVSDLIDAQPKKPTKTRKCLEWTLMAGGIVGAITGAVMAENSYSKADQIIAEKKVNTINQLPQPVQENVIQDYIAGNRAVNYAFISTLATIGGAVSWLYRTGKEKQSSL